MIGPLPDTGLRGLGRAVSLAWAAAPGLTAANAALTVVQGLLPLLSLYLLKLLVDSLSAGAGPQALDAAMPWLLLMCLAVVAEGALGAVSRIGAELLSERVTNHCLGLIDRKAAELDLAYLEDPRHHDLIHRAQAEGPHRPTRVVQALVALARCGVCLLGVGAVLLTLDWQILALIALAVAPWTVARLTTAAGRYRWHLEATPNERRARYLSWVLTAPAHAKEVRTFDLGSLLAGRHDAIRAKLRRSRSRLFVRQALVEALAVLLGVGALLAALQVTLRHVDAGSLRVGDLAMYLVAVFRGQSLFQGLLRAAAELYESNLFLKSFHQFVGLDSRVEALPAAPPVPVAVERGIAFEVVSFTYPGASGPALEDASFVVHPGETVAVVGENGSGKSTLLKLLCGLYSPTRGRITIDGADLRRMAQADLRRTVAATFQDYGIYQVSALENIWYGDTDKPCEVESVRRCARVTGADRIIGELPEGYRTNLGKAFALGHELSQGQYQKVALARTLLRETPVIALDEPTSALDPRSERDLLDNVRAFARGRVIFVVSHRYAVVSTADRVLVLEAGRIVENGDPATLASRPGRFRELFAPDIRAVA